jgi:hypothetical protein
MVVALFKSDGRFFSSALFDLSTTNDALIVNE